MVDVSHLVSQMHETLSTIHDTIASLSTTEHDATLDALEQQRDSALDALRSNFDLESESLSRKRKAERDEIAERRRKEDEERERRRRQEDEGLAERDRTEDSERQGRLDGEKRGVEEETDSMMDAVEEEARKMLEEGQARLAALEEKRRELNRLIDEQLKVPLPSAPSRRRARAGLNGHLAVAANSKPPAPAPAMAEQHVGNNVKAPDDERPNPQGDPPRSPAPWWEKKTAFQSALDVLAASGFSAAGGERKETPGPYHEVTNRVQPEEDGERESAQEYPVDVPPPAWPRHAPVGQSENITEAVESLSHHEPAESTPRGARPGNVVGRPDDRREADSVHEEAPHESSSLLGKMGNAVLSLVAPSSGNDNQDKQKRSSDSDHDRSRTAPGYYPLSEVQSPMEDIPETSLGDAAPQRGFPDDDERLGASVQDGDPHPANQAMPHNQDLGHPADHEHSVIDKDTRVATEHNSRLDPYDTHKESDELRHEDAESVQEPAHHESLQDERPGDNDELPALRSDDSPESHAEHFDLSDTPPIPGTMTHGVDEPETPAAVEEEHGNAIDMKMPEAAAVDDLEDAPVTEAVANDAVSSTTAEIAQLSEAAETEGLVHPHSRETISEQDVETLDHGATLLQPKSDDVESMGHKSDAEDAGIIHESAPEDTATLEHGHKDQEGPAYDITDQATGQFVDAARLESDMGQVTDDESTHAPASVDEIAHGETAPHPPQDMDLDEEAQTPTESTLYKQEDQTQPYIEYGPEEDSHASIPEQLQNPPATGEPRAGTDVPVSEAVGSLVANQELGHFSNGDDGHAKMLSEDRSFRPNEEAEADQGLHEVLEESHLAPHPAERQYSDYLTTGSSNTDTESQAYMTPLQSVGFRSPLGFDEDGANLAGEQGRREIPDDGDHTLHSESAATVQGQEDLFEDDDDSGASSEFVEDPPLSDEEEEDNSLVKEQVIVHHAGNDNDVPRTAVPATNEPITAAPGGQISHESADQTVGEIATASSTSDSGYLSEIPAPGGQHPDLNSMANWADEVAEAEDKQTTPQMHPAPLQPTPEISPLSLRHASPITPHRGLAASRHAPKQERPVTPPHQTAPQYAQPTQEEEDMLAPSAFVPRDVTNIPWHVRNDSVPMSLHSQTTLSSSPSSPIHSSLPVDSHEPVIRDSWPTPAQGHLLSGMGSDLAGGRLRNNSTISQSDYDPFRYESSGQPGGSKSPNPSPSPLTAKWARRRDSAPITPPPNGGTPGSQRNSYATNSPSSLFQKMRNIFEPPTGSPSSTNATSPPARSRPVSGVWYSVGRSGGGGGGTEPNDAEAGVNERSSLLQQSSADYGG